MDSCTITIETRRAGDHRVTIGGAPSACHSTMYQEMLMSHGESQDLNTERHQERADDMADAMRRFLVGINTGGIGVVLALASRDRASDLGSWELLFPFVVFIFGIIMTGVSLFLQKHKAIKRRDAAINSADTPDYDRFLWRNQDYDIIAGSLFIVGVVVGVLGLLCR